MIIRGNKVEHVDGEKHYLRCRWCNKPFMLRGFRLKKPPKSCGCLPLYVHSKAITHLKRKKV